MSCLDHLRVWMEFAMQEPTPLPQLAERLAKFEESSRAGRDRLYGIFTPDERLALGAMGLHPRIGPGGIEIGYWLRESAVEATSRKPFVRS